MSKTLNSLNTVILKISQTAIITKIHLIISVWIVIPVSLVYGFNPSSEFDIHLNTVDEHNFFKAIMGLYLGFSILWILGIFKANFLKMALISNIIFMLGLGVGRGLSWIIDGTPTFGYQFGVFAELFLGFYGLWALNRKYYKKP
ncbi:DUF4345 domain-containing protein [Winogradskyella forsetii]|uniref:DUF4345 domain-containing protein n=1 Tax=Winogradskyella forsetii TaxID=2686077 RepID=UPI00211872D9|nr:DUF4345 domain-containing protein [Winogradskyella forsetii]